MSQQGDFHWAEKPLEKTREINNESRTSEEGRN